MGWRMEEFERWEGRLAALGETERLRTLVLLIRKGPMSVEELSAQLSCNRAVVSRRLAMLGSRGWTERRLGEAGELLHEVSEERSLRPWVEWLGGVAGCAGLREAPAFPAQGS